MSSGHRPPSDCPVCGVELVTSRLGCPGCGTELSGHFARCDFCALDAKELELLRVFLSSRGNLREVEKHLGVSYPTARARFTDLLVKLGLAGDESPADPREQVLAQVSDGSLSPEQAAILLAKLT
ncbi:MAG TPA: DUF2089 domain-containing protein [Micropruina sp.]|jgi:hypothetical protein|nr:DUF2089 domain-containing protein [Micropruina sp.]